MKNTLIEKFEARAFKGRKNLPDFRPGDTVRVSYKIFETGEEGKFRIQPYEGVVICHKKGGVSGSFTVRKIGAGGIGVERVFPLYSPHIDKVEVIASGVVRRARLYFLRDLSGKAARIRSRYLPGISVDDAAIAAEKAAHAAATLPDAPEAKEAPKA